MSKKTTRNALFTSLMSLLLCASMLVGTTFAWFTDSVTSSGNIIKSGVLDVEMYWADGTKAVPAVDSTDWKNAADPAYPIFNYDLWEPGYAEVRHILIRNVGTLALKYQLGILPTGEVSDLSDVIDVYFVDGGVQVANRSDLVDAAKVGTLTQVLAGMPENASGTLLAGNDVIVTLGLKMQEEAGNEYMDKAIGSDFNVILNASQMASEPDSFDEKYDVPAQWPTAASGYAPVVANGSTPVTVYDLNDEGSSPATEPGKVAVFTFPAESVADEAEDIAVKIVETDRPAGLTISSANQQAKSYDITVTGMKPGNTANVFVELYVGEGLSGIEVYHDTDKIHGVSYQDGWIRFYTQSFSPYTIVYDAVTVEEGDDTHEPGENPSDLPTGMPVAIVTDADDCENKVLPWENLGGFYPNDPEHQTLEAAYVFKAPHDGTTVAECAFKDWHCDYYVMLDRDLGENQIFLGGNYGDWGWIGFDNGDITLSANEAIPLLGSVTKNPWTYEAIVNFVGEFTCGVAQSYGSNALEDATFTVMLRLTNPNDASEYYNVNTVTYTF